MQVRTGIRLAALCAALGAATAAGWAAGAQEPPRRPSTLEVNQVLRVGDRIVTAEDLIARIRDAEMEDPKGKKFVVPSLLYLRDVALLELEAERLGLILTEEEIDKHARRQIDALKAEVKRQYQGILTWSDFVKESYGKTEEEFEAYLRERLPVILRRRVLVNYFMQATEGVEVWRILVERESAAEEICEQLRKTGAKERLERFKELAVQKSIDAGSNLNQGRVGRVFRHAWTIDPPEGEAAVWALADGEVSKPVKSRGGYSVIMRAQTFTPSTRSFADLRAELLDAPDVDASASNTWVLYVGNTRKYPIEQRVPGIDCKPNQKAGK